jgi:hypothetical protein
VGFAVMVVSLATMLYAGAIVRVCDGSGGGFKTPGATSLCRFTFRAAEGT